MAKATRIDSYQKMQDGRVFIKITRGEAPLPLSTDTEATETLEFANEQAFMDQIKDADTRVSMDMHLIQAGQALKSDPLLGAAFKTAYVGKTASVDLTGTATAIKLG